MAFPFLTDGIHPSGWVHLPNSVTVKKKLLMRFTHLNTIKLFNTHHPGSFFFFFLNGGERSNTRALHQCGKHCRRAQCLDS